MPERRWKKCFVLVLFLLIGWLAPQRDASSDDLIASLDTDPEEAQKPVPALPH